MKAVPVTNGPIVLMLALLAGATASAQQNIRVEQLLDGPIIHPGLDPSIGENIQEPTLIRTPDWATGRLGDSYMPAFEWDGYTDAITMPGQFWRSRDGLCDLGPGPRLFNTGMRHAALLIRDKSLYVFWTQVGDAPEHIKLSTIDIDRHSSQWRESEAFEVLSPEHDREGADAPIEPSVRSTACEHVNQLRDPAICEEDGRVFPLYAVASEAGIALAEVLFQ